jgi:hypothetical protein
VDAAVMVNRTIAKQTQIQRRISAAEEDCLTVVATLDDVLWVAGCIRYDAGEALAFPEAKGSEPFRAAKGI